MDKELKVTWDDLAMARYYAHLRQKYCDQMADNTEPKACRQYWLKQEEEAKRAWFRFDELMREKLQS